MRFGFSRPFRLDEWLLTVADSPVCQLGKRFYWRNKIFNQKGELVLDGTRKGCCGIRDIENAVY